jgi:hypothetical protein
VSTSDDDGGWLSPTRAWRVAQCPASAGPGAAGVVQIDGPPQNKGSLAHRVVDLWVRAHGYEGPDVRGAMRAAIDQAVAEVASEMPPDWTLTGKRLLARAPALADALGTDVGDVISERTIRDAALRVYGTPDIVVLGHKITLIDLKTEQFDDSELSSWIRFQLSVYAYLVEQEHGRPPDRVEVFSTHRGRIPVPLISGANAAVLDALEAARRMDPSVAIPSEDACRFCRRRFQCDAQWDAAPTWLKPDCVAGRVSRVERATNGLTGMWLESADGLVLLSGVPTMLVPDIDGSVIRAVRVNAVERGEEKPLNWRWGTRSALMVVPSS